MKKTPSRPLTSAAEFIPSERSLRTMQQAAKACRGCDLYKNATQTVFGQGNPRASIMLVGEQPGNQEDLSGQPFVGPAGALFDKALQAAGIDRSEVYVTNAVKHFKWEPRGKKRIHKKPSAREIAACKPWLEKEIELVRPQLLVLLGATAAQSLLGNDFRITRERGRVLARPNLPPALATVHPSAILRAITSEDRRREFEGLVQDLIVAARFLARKAA